MANFFNKILLFLVLILIIVKLLILTAVFFVKGKDQFTFSVDSQKLIELTNHYRQQNGLSALAVNERLTQAAVNKAKDILQYEYFNHTSPEGKKFSQWIKDVNYEYFYIGENLAIDFNNNEDLFNAWTTSPEHDENLLRPQYQEIGIAAVTGKYNNHETVVVVQLFGSRNKNIGFEPISLKHTKNNNAILTFNNLEKLNETTNYFLVIILIFTLTTYIPRCNNKSSKIKQPIISLYQAKKLRE